jgi:hypothetical protein
MSKLGLALGKKYEENRLAVLTRSFELGGHTFKVKVPSVSEIEAIYNYSKNPNIEEIEKAYQTITEDIRKVEGIKEENNDIVIDGRSMRETASNKHILQYRITAYIKFLIGENGETLDQITYEDIEAEFPLAIQLTLIEKINEVISPEYKEVRSK